MKRDKKDTDFATEETIKHSNIKKHNERVGHAKPRPQREEDLIIDEKKSKSTTL